MKTLAVMLVMVGCVLAENDSIVCESDAFHDICRFSDGSVTETICLDNGCSSFHWSKAYAAKHAKELAVQSSYEEKRGKKILDYMRKGMTLGEADRKVHDDEMAKPDPGVEKARIELCQKGILKGDRCK